MAVQNITGNVVDVVGTAYSGAILRIRPLIGAWQNGAQLVFGEAISVTADGNGDVDFSIETGAYEVVITLSYSDRYRFGMVVGTDGPYDIADVVQARQASNPTSVLFSSSGLAVVTGTPLQGRTALGLGNVPNLAAEDFPVSTAQQQALDAKAPLDSPAFTGTPTGITKEHVGLGNVPNLAAEDFPISTAQQAALDEKMGAAEHVIQFANLQASLEASFLSLSADIAADADAFEAAISAALAAAASDTSAALAAETDRIATLEYVVANLHPSDPETMAFNLPENSQYLPLI